MVKTTKEIKVVHLGLDIPRWKILSGKKYWFQEGYATKQEVDRIATSLRKQGMLVRIQKHAEPFKIAFGDKRILKYTLWIHKPEK